VKLLFDENLSPRLAEVLADVYPGSSHVYQCGLGSSDDDAIWRYAADNGFAIISKDSDFQERSVLRGAPPKIIWLRAVNCTTTEIEHLVRAAQPNIAIFLEKETESCLELGLRPATI
jgi:predicted nuclease of predicted toxin-antitoxin system